jgi:pimeloyl-ACP methyl ester carboxylesterase
MKRAWVIAAGLVFVGCSLGCRPARHPGKQVSDLRSVLLDTSIRSFGSGAPGKLTLPHGSRDTRFAAVLIVGDWAADVPGDEQPGAEAVLRELAEGLGHEAFACLRITDWGPPARPEERVRSAWRSLAALEVVDPNRMALFVQGDAAYRVLPLVATLKPKALVLLGPPGRPFRDVARGRLRRALEPGDSEQAALAALEAWMDGATVPRQAWAKHVLGNAPEGYYRSLLDQDPLARLTDAVPALVIRGEDDSWTEVVDAERAAAVLGARLVQLPLADHRAKAIGPGISTGPSDPVVPEVVESALELLVPLLRPRDLRAD